MIYGSVCSGIEAATVAWHPLGWKPAFFSEIEPAPRSVLAHHYSDVPCHGDFTTIGANEYGPIDLLVGGTPCQSFSIAGLRGGLDDDRGNLALEFIKLAQRTRPRWVVWENVPGVLSSNRGRDFGTFLAALGEIGYGFAYRVLDAQYFGVAQRRCRVFVVGCLGDWRRAAAVLFERHSLQGHSAPRREKGRAVAGKSKSTIDENSWPADVTSTLNAAFGSKLGLEDQHIRSGAPLFVPDTVGTLTAKGPTAMGAPEVDAMHYIATTAVRRITPRECERLQGFPDDYTLVQHRNKPMSDGPRYKALGNSMAVPVMRWIGERIAMVDALL